MTTDFQKETADFFVPDGVSTEEALLRTTHLAIGAHQDDLEIMAYHGIAECYREDGLWFGGIVATDGAGSARKGPYADYSDAQMQALRREEQRQAAALGEYSFQVQLDYPSSEVKSSSSPGVVDDLKRLLEWAQPQVLYLHNPADKHDTHVALLLRCLEALRQLPIEKRPGKVYGCEVWRDLDWLVDADKVALPVDKHPELAGQLIAVFDSQIRGGKRYDLATAGRRLANATYFESHATDSTQAITWALDLTPLAMDSQLSIEEFVAGYLQRFSGDVVSRIKQFSD